MMRDFKSLLRLGLVCFFLCLLNFFLINDAFSQRTGSTETFSYFRDAFTITTRQVRLSDDKVLIAYKEGNSSTDDFLMAMVATYSGGTLSYGTPMAVTGDLSNSVADIAAFSSSKAIVVWENNDDEDDLQYRILDIDGSDIIVRDPGSLGPGDELASTASLKVATLTDESVVVVYENKAGSQLTMVAGTLDGTTVNWGSTVSNGENTFYTDIVRVSDTKFAVGYEFDTGTDQGKVIAGTVTGNSISLGTAQAFETTSAVATIAMATLSETEVVVAYEDDGGGDKGKIFYATLSGTVWTFPGNETEFSTDDTIGEIDMDPLSSTEVLIGINRGSNSHSLYAVGKVNGNDIDMSAESFVLELGEADDIQVSALTSDLAVLVYADDNGKSGTTNGGEARVISFIATTNPEINVQGNSTDIVSGDNIPTTTDHTDFGTGGSLSRTFTIQNQGTGTLTLGSNAVTITGTHASDFSVNTQPATSVAGNGSTTFIIDFSSTVASARTAEIHINSDDVHESDYIFSIQAVGGASAPTSATVAVTAILEGAWNGSNAMNTHLEEGGLIPTADPYDGLNGHDADATPAVASIPDGVVDWVLVELREADLIADADDGSRVGSAAGFLMEDGSIVATNGSSNLSISLSGNSGADFYVVVYHRNHLPIMSLNEVTESSGVYTIDLSSSANVYESANAVSTLAGSSKVGMHAGNTDDDSDIDNDDLATWRSNNGAAYSYSTNGDADFNLDGVINAVDRNEFHQKNTAKTRQLPD